MPATEEATAELFDDIDAPYFIESGFDATDYELQKMLGVEFELDELERERFKLKRQLQVVSKKVSSLIMKNSLTFSTEVKHYSQIQAEADTIVQLIKQIRSTLGENRRNCVAAIGIVANDRNQKYLLFLKKVLATIKTLHETEYRLKELIQEGDFLVLSESVWRLSTLLNVISSLRVSVSTAFAMFCTSSFGIGINKHQLCLLWSTSKQTWNRISPYSNSYYLRSEKSKGRINYIGAGKNEYQSLQ
uniref:Vacuolar protein sorting-associated protein 54 N-terminal domain-containing protein n=1 Tax=Ditylenchus dipsaci TaxID=166011 RepID=A0A915DWA2_9BILA